MNTYLNYDTSQTVVKMLLSEDRESVELGLQTLENEDAEKQWAWIALILWKTYSRIILDFSDRAALLERKIMPHTACGIEDGINKLMKQFVNKNVERDCFKMGLEIWNQNILNYLFACESDITLFKSLKYRVIDE